MIYGAKVTDEQGVYTTLQPLQFSRLLLVNTREIRKEWPHPLDELSTESLYYHCEWLTSSNCLFRTLERVIVRLYIECEHIVPYLGLIPILIRLTSYTG